MITEEVRYYLPIYKTGGNYLRVTRNSAFLLPCPASLKRQLDNCCSLLLVGDVSLTKFVIVGFTDKPYYKVYDWFKVRGKVPEHIRFMMKMRMRMNLSMPRVYPLTLPKQKTALDSYLDGSKISLFS